MEQQLLGIREEIVRNLQQEERPESLQHELLDEVRSIDRELAAIALFSAPLHMYQIPEIKPPIAQETALEQADVLFHEENFTEFAA